MDTLSTSVSTFKIPTLHPKSHQYVKNHLPQQPHLFISSTTKPKPKPKPKPSKLSSNKSKTNTTLNNNFITPPFVNTTSSQPLKQSSTPQHLTHQKPATGYAVALLDIARHNDVVEAVQRDVTRLSKYLRNDQIKGEVLKEVVRKGKFHKYLVRLVNLLFEKNKVDMVSEVLVEFGRIYDELSCNNNNNTQLVFVSSGVKKMEENQVLEIAKRVQNLTGAVKVKVRQLFVDEKLPQFAL
ncbi:hypothetical protein BUALT_Bualt01G0242900 [Buddleja alternifolia]|uniref:ATP synthase delta chain, chloroplastic n=1 Tax=Buddleja alternifolia TaxID=168488 RepID=A0AAV6Y9S5_9LAMI|nr:hypothetical protein BUALT_Bualt01G0242900 [Buddleja alternifolia]